ncbi:MAG TPA: alpha-amylase [Chloroflexi bacterium]|nr:alpha-amylase [Chloroflexota bacterium]
MPQIAANPAHNTFPLTRQALDRLSLTPEFDYLDPDNARLLNNRLKAPLPAYTPGEISAVGLIGKIYLRVIDLYLIDSSPTAFRDLDKMLQSDPGSNYSDSIINLFLDHFPTSLSRFSHARSDEYLLSFSGSPANRHGLYKSFLLIFMADSNQAMRNKDHLFTDPELLQSPHYSILRTAIFGLFADQPSFASGGKSLIEFLIEPALLHPDSLYDQLEFIRQNWAPVLGDDYLLALLKTLDYIKEGRGHPSGSKAIPQDPLGFSLASYQTENDQIRFSADLDWMPNVILLAKNIFVWLDQLSKEYQTSIYQLCHIPDQELEKLSSWGITGLWLIGLWQRSSASQKIKQICGNLDAVPSAYSLYDYSISDSLGGEEAYQDLSNRAARFNIRLAADMVPNHMGIYSNWVIEHPDWFLSVNKPPFPGYSFNGPDLSEDQRVGIFLEDHYYDKTDAAVVFKRLDRHTSSEKFIYHGNDGTSMPWNDTAQLDFLNPEVREAVIQNILHVAKKFPIIRFDAAMTLTKKHIQRLWFPEPGSGGAIPTRSEFGLNKTDFNRLMPKEFWLEVVDRVASEAPDTLLLAEAFWMMEGYFVRNLGMHRVYNSAFMHMLRDEDNKKYRGLIIKTLEYDPQILKRYVNFMNNPDEDTAISQYGTDGKYFGVCVLLSTLPGLPMFGHGQVEGFSEKYGMEYQRAYYNEEPNQGLIERHQREIFPLLHKRYLFADVDNFALFDFVVDNGSFNENVFAFTNRFGSESALVVFHNKWGDTSGSVQRSVAINGSSIRLIDALGLSPDDGDFILFRDQISGLEYISSLAEFSSSGILIDLGAYDYRVFVDFKVITDKDGTYSHLYSSISNSGVPSLHHALLELRFAPLSEKIDVIFSTWVNLSATKNPTLLELDTQLSPLINDLESILSILSSVPKPLPEDYQTSVIERLQNLIKNFHAVFPDDLLSLKVSSVLWSLLFDIFASSAIPDIEYLFRTLSKQQYIGTVITVDLLFTLNEHSKFMRLLTPLLANSALDLNSLIDIWFDPSCSNTFLGLNEYNGITWFNKESFETLLNLTYSYFIFTEVQLRFIDHSDDYIAQLLQLRDEVLDCMQKSKFQVEIFHNALTRLIKEWNSQTANSRS